MSVLGPLDLTPALARLTSLVPELTTVGGVLEYALAKRKPPAQSPAAYVVRATERANGAQPASMIATNKVVSTFSVCLAFTPDFSQAFTAQNLAIDAIETKVREALCGWRVTGATNFAVEFVSSELDGTSDQTIWVNCIFSTSYHQRYTT